MSTDLLNVAANERIDLADFRHAVDASFQENLRQFNTNVLTSPAKQQDWILDGFEMTNPAGKQLQVTKGRALLGQREGAIAYQGVLTTEGDATKIVDMTALAPNTYNIYIRFEYVDADSASRIFWDATGTEVSQTHPTRRTANWSVRVETTSPGAEWMLIGTADNTDVPVPGQLFIVDQRPLYFEGLVNQSFESGWSAEGGGVANDRNADRLTYGVQDFQTFTGAMRQCLTDIRGRGLREWYEKGIGGINVGFDDDPVENRIAIGDDEFRLLFDGTNPYIYFDSATGHTRIYYNRALERFYHDVDGNTEMVVRAEGVQVNNGLVVGNISTVPTDNEIFAVGDIESQANLIGVDVLASSGIRAGGGTTDPGAGDAILAGGLVVGFDAAPTDDRIDVGDANFNMQWVGATDVLLRFDANDQIQYDRSNDHMNFNINGEIMRLQPEGMTISHGLYVGTAATVPNDNDIHATGAITCGQSLGAGTVTQANAGDGIFTRGLVVGFDAAPADNDRIEIGDATFFLDWSATATTLRMDTDGGNSGIQLDKTNDELDFQLLGATQMRMTASGLAVANGIYAGNVAGIPTANDIMAASDVIAGAIVYAGTQFRFSGAADYIHNSDNTWMEFVINGTAEMQLKVSGLAIQNGLYVGSTAGTPTDDDIYAEGTIDCVGDLTAGSITMAGNIYTTGQIGRDATDYIAWAGNDYMQFVTNDVEEMRLDADGLRILNGLYVGSITGTATDNDIYAQGDIQAAAEVRGTTVVATTSSWAASGTANGFRFASTDYVALDTTSGDLWFVVDSAVRAYVAGDGELYGSGKVTTGGRLVQFGSGATPDDYIQFDNPNDWFEIFINATECYRFGAQGADFQSRFLQGVTNIIATGSINCPKIGADAFGDNDYMSWVTNTSWHLYVNSVEELRVVNAGLNVSSGLTVGDLTTAPTDNDLTVIGGIKLGAISTAVSAGQLIASSGAVIGYDGAVVDNRVNIGDANFGFLWNSASTVYHYFDSNDYHYYQRTTDERFGWAIASQTKMNLRSGSGLSLEDGLYVGNKDGTATINDVRCEGNFHSSNSVIIPFGHATFSFSGNLGTGTFIHDRVPISGYTSWRDTGATDSVCASLHVPASGTITQLRVQLDGTNLGDYRIRLFKRTIATSGNGTAVYDSTQIQLPTSSQYTHTASSLSIAVATGDYLSLEILNYETGTNLSVLNCDVSMTLDDVTWVKG